jgi:hypothetical protein
MEDICLQIDDM